MAYFIGHHALPEMDKSLITVNQAVLEKQYNTISEHTRVINSIVALINSDFKSFVSMYAKLTIVQKKPLFAALFDRISETSEIFKRFVHTCLPVNNSKEL